MSEHDKLPLDRDALDHIAECIRSHGVNVPPVGDATMFALVDQAHAAIRLSDALAAGERERDEAVLAFVARVNARAEADMLAGNPVTGAHHRAIETEAAAIRALAEREVRT